MNVVEERNTLAALLVRVGYVRAKVEAYEASGTGLDEVSALVDKLERDAETLGLRRDLSAGARRVYELVDEYLTREMAELEKAFADYDAQMAELDPRSDESADNASQIGYHLVKYQLGLLADRRTVEAWRDAAT